MCIALRGCNGLQGSEIMMIVVQSSSNETWIDQLQILYIRGNCTIVTHFGVYSYGLIALSIAHAAILVPANYTAINEEVINFVQLQEA